MSFVGIDSIESLVKKAHNIELTRDDFESISDFEFVTNFQIDRSSLVTERPVIAPEDRSVGIMSPYLEEGGASIVGKTHMSKASATEVLLTHETFDGYLNQRGLFLLDEGDILHNIKEILKNSVLGYLGDDASYFVDDINECLKDMLIKLKNIREENRTIYLEIEFSF